MTYTSTATTTLCHRADNLQDWNQAYPGQWFIGVIDTSLKYVFLVPVNVFEARGALNENVLNNTDPRGINRYASGAPNNRYGIMQGFFSLLGGNWLANRPIGQTHHTCVAIYYRSDPQNCLGFSLIKLAPGFAQIKFSSASLNTKPGYHIGHSFSRATFRGTSYEPGTPQMPFQWARALVTYLKAGPYAIRHIAESGD